MTIRLTIAQHGIRSAKMIEVWDDDVFIAGIYPSDPRGVKIISKYGVIRDDGKPAFEATVKFGG